MEYLSFVFERTPDFSAVPAAKINSFHWEEPGFSRPESAAKLCVAAGSGIYARLWSYESNILARCEGRDGEVWKDSCLELFIAPIAGDKRYMNFEMNPNGALLCEIGEARHDRRLISELTAVEPVVSPFRFGSERGNAWGCSLFIPERLISELYGIDFKAGEGEMKGNFYKCADDSASPHFGAHFPAGSAELGFHNPDCFGSFIFKNFSLKG